MGTLYLGRDPVLDRPVAVKVIRADYDDPALRERFVNEARSVSRLRHPNIVTVFEYGEFEGQPFLAMEYVGGESLRDVIEQRAPLTLARKLQIIDEVCAGMAAAHHARLIHRDLKPDNIMLDGESGLVKIVDFGLARMLQPDASRFTQGIGSPNYMAPEQFMGQTDARSDIYGIGAVGYELLSYQQAFSGQSPFSLMNKIVMEPPPPLDRIYPDLDPAIVRIIERALEKEPARRYQDLDAMREDLRAAAAALPDAIALTSHAPARPPVPIRRRALPWGIAAAAVLALAVSSWSARDWIRTHLPSAVAAAPAGKARRSVAVIGFKNLAGRPDAAWLSTALAEMFTTELSAGERLRTIPGENVARMKIDLSLADADSFAGDTLKRIRQNIGSDLVLLGSYMTAGARGAEQIRLDVRLQDAATGETIAVVSDTASEAELLDLVSRTGARVRGHLGLGELAGIAAATVQASLPSTPDATRLYAEGLRRMRVYDHLAAQQYFERALAADPNAPLVHAAMAAAWSALGYDSRAADEASRAFERSGKLAPEDRLSVEGRLHEIRREWNEAIRVYTTLFDQFPDNIEYGLRLARAQESAGRAKDALATVDALRKLASHEAADPRIDLAEASAARSLSDLRRAAAAAERAASIADAQGARVLVARARLQQGSALLDLAQFDAGQRALEQAKRIFDDAGDRAAAARTSNNLGQLLARRGNLPAAKQLLEQALNVYRDLGNESGVALARTNLGNVAMLQGRLTDAVAEWEQALATFRQLNEKDGIARAQNNIANVLGRLGDTASVERRLEEALSLWQQMGRRREAAVVLDNLASLAYDAGHLARTRQLNEQALAIYKDVGDRSHVAGEFDAIADVLFVQGELADARRYEQESLALHEQIGEPREAATARHRLARIAMEEGRYDEAATLARAALAEYERENVPPNIAWARALVAEILLRQGRRNDACAAIRQAMAAAPKGDKNRLLIDVNISAARVLSNCGEPAAVIRELEATLRDARRQHSMPRELNAGLALGEVEIAAGRAAAGRARLAAIEKQARASGFALIAQKAAAAKTRGRGAGPGT